MSNPYAAPQFPQEPTPEQPAPKKKKGGCLKWGAGAVAVLVLGSAALNAGSDGDEATNTAAPESNTSITSAESVDAALNTPTLDINNAAANVESTPADAVAEDNAVPSE